MFDVTPRMSVEPNRDGSYTYEWLCHGCGERSDDHFITSTDALHSPWTLHRCDEDRDRQATALRNVAAISDDLDLYTPDATEYRAALEEVRAERGQGLS